jgi:hypothetical protein
MELTAAIDLLLSHFSPEERETPDNAIMLGRNADCIKAVSSALQELYGDGGAWMRKGTEGYLLYGPLGTTATVTLGSKVIAFTSWQPWFAGCTCRVGGASVDNEIASETSLILPHDGPTGTTTVTIYHDSIDLGVTIAGVLKPVKIAGGTPLTPVSSPSQLTPYRDSDQDYGIHHHITDPIYRELDKGEYLGTPRLYTVDTYIPDAYTSPTFRLRISPAPDKQMLLQARVKYRAPILTEDSFFENLPCPLDYVESILLPIALQHLTASQFFRNDAGKAEIARQYTRALQLAKSAAPQSASALFMRPLI